MNFGKEKFLIAFLNDSSLKFASYELSSKGMRRMESEQMEFSDIIVRDSTIADAGGFTKQVSEFLAGKSEWAKFPIILAIPEEKIFIKGFELELGDLERKEEIRRGYLNEVPFLEEELMVRERLVGRVMELSAVHKKFIEDLQKPFSDGGFEIGGIISVPQALALELRPKEKHLLLAFYDNDLAFVLAENASVLFSETERMKKSDLKEALRGFNHFIQHLKIEDLKTISLIVGEDEVEGEIKTELEKKGYEVREIRKINILDFLADYYSRNADDEKDWNLLFKKSKGMMRLTKKGRSFLVYFASILILAGIVSGGWLFYERNPYLKTLFERRQDPESQMVIPEEPVIPETEIIPEEDPEELPPPVINKEEFSISIFNGTAIAGEAGRLRTVLQGAGFTVSEIGNHEDQAQTLTTLFVGSNVPESLVVELKSLLETSYSQVVISPSPVVGEDIHIVIGTKK
jgi:hypothetical protein